MNKAVLRGQSAEVRWVYQRAAILGPWTMTMENVAGETSVSAEVLTTDAFRVSQQPLVFVVPRQKGAPWRWPIKTVEIADGTLRAALGPQE